MPVVVAAVDRIVAEDVRRRMRRCCRPRSPFVDGSVDAVSVRDGDHASRDAT
jgi:hypothetical protein